ncbi:hypothetical protein M0812_02260 [Anaeramoeba flamelloides]|uniref:Uncharacterized protein n=1 Tax=Anaeramoeba flamelloides TaxID=1746091 RepID=A0AAV7Z649_9EUKA|nr:hypothetical protein M0812_02260 [Anaeramoeba flamelloides]
MNNYYFEKYQELSNDHLELLNHVEEIKNRNKELESKNSQNLSKNTEMKKLEEQFNLMAIKNNEVKLYQDQEDSLNIPNNWRNIDSGNKILFEKREKIDLKRIKRVFYYENEQDTEGDFPMIIMTTNNQLLNLGNNQQIYVDGTYLECSLGYHCLMTIMAYDFQTQIYIPCVWGILSDEKASTQLFFYNYTVSFAFKAQTFNEISGTKKISN